MQSPSLVTSDDAKPVSPVSAAVISQFSGYSVQQISHTCTQVSTEASLFSVNDQVQGLPCLLTKAALLEHSLQQQLTYFNKHDLEKPSQEACDTYKAPERPRYIYKRSRTFAGFSLAERLARSPAISIKEGRSDCRTSSLDRGREIHPNCFWLDKDFVSTPQHPLKPEDPSVADADAQETASLWREVATMSGRQSFLPKPTNSVSRSSGTSKKLKAASPYGDDFVQRVLEPRCIKISWSYPLKAYKHFNVDEPNGDRVCYYTEKREAPCSSVWLESGDAFVSDIVQEYSCMSQRRLCEAEFAAFARETLLKRERRAQGTPQAIEGRCWKTERLIELVAKPITHLWRRPPLVGREYAKLDDKSYTDYGFDLRPDCAYWLSLQAFSPDYKVHVQEHIHVVHDTITCPYLTIEFKRDDVEDQAAFNQVAAAAALALYNRYLLRRRSLDLAKQKWDQQHLKHLKHYGITFTGSSYSIWCIHAVLTNRYYWNGCHMERVFLGNCERAISVRDLIDWINEIHCWGLTVHGPECQKDVKVSLKAMESSTGLRVSDIASLVSRDDIEPEAEPEAEP